MTLVSFWFIVITLLWVGFFVLEGFDFGVGALHTVVGRDESERRAAINTIGPLWDGNEVWLIVAGAAMFAAFPGWYATMFSALYLALVLVLVALILRGVSFEFRGKGESDRWRGTWSGTLVAGSLLAPFLIGVGLGDLLHGLPVDARQEFTGGFLDLLAPYALFVGLTLVLLCLLAGATFLTLKTTGDVRERSRRLARPLVLAAVPVVVVCALWTHAEADRGVLPNLTEVAAVLAVLAAAWMVADGHEGWAFVAATVTTASLVASIFVDLYPRLLRSTTSPAYDLTTANSASGSYALTVMTVVVAVLFPVVLGYQAWTYHVFRRRVGAEQFE